MRRNTFAAKEAARIDTKALQVHGRFFKERVRKVCGNSGVSRISGLHHSEEILRRGSYSFVSDDILLWKWIVRNDLVILFKHSLGGLLKIQNNVN